MTAKPISQLFEDSRALRELIMCDRARPAYHTVCPEDDGVPGDPNATFYANGRVHLMFLYHCEGDGFRFGHLSCADLLHWHRHPDALIPDELDRGIFSGGAFVDDDGTVYIAYWSLKGEDIEACNNGIRIAYSRDIAHDYTHWKKMPEEAVAATEHGILTVTEADGTVRHLPAADPSNIWKKDGFYYLQAGNLPVLNRYGREGGTAEYSGDYIGSICGARTTAGPRRMRMQCARASCRFRPLPRAARQPIPIFNSSFRTIGGVSITSETMTARMTASCRAPTAE